MRALRTYLLCLLLALTPALSSVAELRLNDGGTWRNITEVKVNDSGTWRTIQQIYVNDSGTWRTVWRYLTVTMPDVLMSADSISPSTSTNQLSVQSNGAWTASVNGDSTSGAGSGTWMTVGANTDFEVMLTGTGNTPAGPALNTWHATSTTRTWSLSTNSPGQSYSFSGTLTFRAVVGGATVDTASISFSVVQA